MLVPRYWAEARRQRREGRRQATVRRWGWSDDSPEAAQAHADTRADEALEQLWRGDAIPRVEIRHAYHGAEGTPIREEIVSRQGETIVTRNSYGAQCLNTPDVLFADVDFPPADSFPLGCLIVVGLDVLFWTALPPAQRQIGPVSILLALGGLIPALIMASSLSGWLVAIGRQLRGGEEAIARRRVERFLRRHPDWSLRLYATPAGMRLLATHRPFTPEEPEVQEFFRSVQADPQYVRMCLRQRCFRARVSPKPWRIGMTEHIQPRTGVWPIAADQLRVRRQWIAEYGDRARRFAACTYLETLGAGGVDGKVRLVQELHDDLCGALTGRPAA